jgi:hypothetical protein
MDAHRDQRGGRGARRATTRAARVPNHHVVCHQDFVIHEVVTSRGRHAGAAFVSQVVVSTPAICVAVRAPGARTALYQGSRSIASAGDFAQTRWVSSKLGGVHARRLRWGTLVCCTATILRSGDAHSGEVTPVEITMLGPAAVSVRVADGTTLPCDSGDNRMLLRGKLSSGVVVHTTTTDTCVCFQQTYNPFTDVDWGPSWIICRPQICKGVGRARHCVRASDPTIRIRVRSDRGG